MSFSGSGSSRFDAESDIESVPVIVVSRNLGISSERAVPNYFASIDERVAANGRIHEVGDGVVETHGDVVDVIRSFVLPRGKFAHVVVCRGSQHQCHCFLDYARRISQRHCMRLQERRRRPKMCPTGHVRGVAGRVTGVPAVFSFERSVTRLRYTRGMRSWLRAHGTTVAAILIASMLTVSFAYIAVESLIGAVVLLSAIIIGLTFRGEWAREAGLVIYGLLGLVAIAASLGGLAADPP